VFIKDHPIEISPLTKRKRGDDRLVERFEPYAAGMEIGNSYSELTDPVDQLERFLGQRETLKAKLGKVFPGDNGEKIVASAPKVRGILEMELAMPSRETDELGQPFKARLEELVNESEKFEGEVDVALAKAFRAKLQGVINDAFENNPIDSDFIKALGCGMPPTGGVGLGIDRLVMLLTDSESIRDIIPFPMVKQKS
jgi:lysyl-tRNA synthetase class II